MASTGVRPFLFLICCSIASLLFFEAYASASAPWQSVHPTDGDGNGSPIKRPDVLKMDTQLASIVAMAKSSLISLQE